MKIALERLDVKALDIELPGEHTAGVPQRVVLREARGLRGKADIDGARTTISGGGAERVAVDAVSLLIGHLHLASRTGLVLDEAGFAFERIGERVSLDVSGTATASDIRITIGNVTVEGVAKLTGAKLFVRGANGTLAADKVELARFRLRVGAVELAADTLTGSGVTIAWGDGGFQLHADGIATPAAKIAHGSHEILVGGLEIGALALGGPKLTIASVAAEKVHTMIDLGAAAEKGAARDGEPLVDFATLDRLDGEIDVDVDVDLAVPLIGHRHATHRLRVPIETGTIDYRSLEDNLAKLEKALLDFTVREGSLVVERVNPLFPSRGHGKPLVFWPLSPADLELAEAGRVRLAVLPDWRLAGTQQVEEEEEDEPSKKSVTLRRLDLLQINVALTLPSGAPTRGQLRLEQVASLVLQGNVLHDPGHPPREGAIIAEAKDVALGLHRLDLGGTHVDAAIRIAALSPIEVAFADVRPTRIGVDAAGLRVEHVVVSFSA